MSTTASTAMPTRMYILGTYMYVCMHHAHPYTILSEILYVYVHIMLTCYVRRY